MSCYSSVVRATLLAQRRSWVRVPLAAKLFLRLLCYVALSVPISFAYVSNTRVYAISERERGRKRHKANLLRINAAWPYHEPFVAPGYQYSLVRLNVKLCNYFISFISYLNKRNQLYMNEPLKQCLHMHTRQRIKLESIWLHRISSRQKHIFLFLFTVWLLSRSPNHVRHIESFMKKR